MTTPDDRSGNANASSPGSTNASTNAVTNAGTMPSAPSAAPAGPGAAAPGVTAGPPVRPPGIGLPPQLAAAAAPVAAPGARRRALAIIAGLVLLAGAGYATYWSLVLNHVESTDNAYVQGNVVQITPQVAGTVVAIQADDNDRVTAGQPLLRLDAADARLALAQAEAQLAQTVREVRSVFSNNSTLGAQVALREAEAARARSDTARAQNEVARAQAEVNRLQDDVNRRAPLVASGAVGQGRVRPCPGAADHGAQRTGRGAVGRRCGGQWCRCSGLGHRRCA